MRPEDPPLPAKLYATSPVGVVAMRIGCFAERPPPGPDVTPGDRAAWLSPDDCAELVRATVEGPVDGFTVVNGVSANRYRKASHGPAEQRLGYRPSDDAWAGFNSAAAEADESPSRWPIGLWHGPRADDHGCRPVLIWTMVRVNTAVTAAFEGPSPRGC